MDHSSHSINCHAGLKSPQTQATSSFGVAGYDQTFHASPERSSVKGIVLAISLLNMSSYPLVI